jgi:hypothetical protein
MKQIRSYQAINQSANTHMESNKIINIYTKEHIRTSPRAKRPQVHKTRPYTFLIQIDGHHLPDMDDP